MRIDSSGRVGIGTNNPDQKLKIEDSSDVAIHILKTGSQDTLLKNTGQTELCAASGGASGQRIAFKIGANTGSLSDIAKFTDTGLCFGSDTAAANALDDYEEGTWTPTSRDGSVTASKAHYTKIGRQVTLHCRLESFTDNSTNDQVTIQGIPFAVNSDKCDIAHGSARYQNISETNNTVCFITHARQGFNFSGGDSGAFSQIRYNELSSSSRIDLIATYFTG